MPLVYESRWLTPILVYDAPLDEKTKKIREEFRVDEETGYPEHYKWRNQAKLGKSFKPEEIFEKFQYKKEDSYQTMTSIYILVTASSAVVHAVISGILRRPVLAKPHHFLGLCGAACYGCHWLTQKSVERNYYKQQAFIDYAKQHPERFGQIQRYKCREVLSHWYPRR